MVPARGQQAGTQWLGKRWHSHDLLTCESDISNTDPTTAPGTALPEGAGKTAKRRRGETHPSPHLKAFRARDVPTFGRAHLTALGLGLSGGRNPWSDSKRRDSAERPMQPMKDKARRLDRGPWLSNGPVFLCFLPPAPPFLHLTASLTSLRLQLLLSSCSNLQLLLSSCSRNCWGEKPQYHY